MARDISTEDPATTLTHADFACYFPELGTIYNVDTDGGIHTVEATDKFGTTHTRRYINTTREFALADMKEMIDG
jgi:hypothetical protein